MCKRERQSLGGGRAISRYYRYNGEKDDSYDLYNAEVPAERNKPYFIEIGINSYDSECEIDTSSQI